MNQVNVLLGYDPRCTFYPKATQNGVVYYYLQVLPPRRYQSFKIS